MKGWTKRRVALILALAMIASQMSGCKDNGTAAQNAVSVSNNNAAVTEETQAPTEETVSEDAEGWLEENLDNIRQSLLDGDYAEVVEILLGMQDQLGNDADFNALLYIAYMGNGDADDAAALLNNPSLDKDKFTDSFLENSEALKENPDIAEIRRQLMEHMLGLGESDPDAYAAVARIGANIQNDDPSDPTAYAARYLAALAAGDEEAAKAILEEAEANGVMAEDLKTTSIAYIEEHDLTNVTVEQVEEGITTSTTYSEAGNVVKVEQTVTNPDGSKTETAMDKNGVIYGVAQYGKDGKLISRIVYHYELVLSPETGRLEQQLAEVEEQFYKNGKISSLVLNDVKADGNTEPNVKLTFNNEGVISSYAVYENGEEKRMPDEKIKATAVEIVDGDVVSTSFPVVDETGKVVGKVVSNYSYHHPAGVIEDRKLFEYGQLVMDGDYSYSYTTGNVNQTEAKATFYDKNGEVLLNTRVDYENNKYEEIWADGSYQEAVLDKTGKYLLTQEVFDDQGVLQERRYAYYTGTEMTSELDVHYDAQGRVVKEVYYGVDREIDLKNPKAEVTYQYAEGQKLITKKEYGLEGNEVAKYQELHNYDANGNVVEKITQTIQNGKLVGRTESAYLYDAANNCYYQQHINTDENGNQTANSQQDFYGADGKMIGTIYKEYDSENGWVQNKQDQYSYNEDGTLKKIDVYRVENGNGTKSHEINYTYNEDGSKKVETKDLATGKSSVAEYTYNANGDTLSESIYEVDTDNKRVEVSTKEYSYDETGNLSGYVVTAKDTNGNTQTTHYTSEGYAYEVAVYDTNGQLLMVMSLDPATGAVVENSEGETAATKPTEDEPSETEPTEGEAVETEPTEGEPAATEPTEGEAVETEPVEEDVVETQPVEEEVVETEPAEEEIVETQPAEVETVATEPVEEPAETEPDAVTEIPAEPKEPETPTEPEAGEAEAGEAEAE